MGLYQGVTVLVQEQTTEIQKWYKNRKPKSKKEIEIQKEIQKRTRLPQSDVNVSSLSLRVFNYQVKFYWI